MTVRGQASVTSGVRRWAAKQLAVDAVMGGLLVAAAGSARWSGGWSFMALVGASQAVQGSIIGRRHPELLAERAGVGEGADRPDIPLAMAMAYAPIIGVVAAALEHRRGAAPHVSRGVRVAALGVAASSVGVTLAAMEANPWFAPVARIQSERGHVVAERGPYALVRHPGYLGAALYDLSLPVLLGSRACVPFSLAGLAVGIVRTIREERFLGTRLAGYREYARRVRWRWLPGIW